MDFFHLIKTRILFIRINDTSLLNILPAMRRNPTGGSAILPEIVITSFPCLSLHHVRHDYAVNAAISSPLMTELTFPLWNCWSQTDAYSKSKTDAVSIPINGFPPPLSLSLTHTRTHTHTHTQHTHTYVQTLHLKTAPRSCARN